MISSLSYDISYFYVIIFMIPDNLKTKIKDEESWIFPEMPTGDLVACDFVSVQQSVVYPICASRSRQSLPASVGAFARRRAPCL